MLGSVGLTIHFVGLDPPSLQSYYCRALHHFMVLVSSDLPHLQVASTTPSSSPAGHPKLLNSGICKEFDFGAAIA